MTTHTRDREPLAALWQDKPHGARHRPGRTMDQQAMDRMSVELVELPQGLARRAPREQADFGRLWRPHLTCHIDLLTPFLSWSDSVGAALDAIRIRPMTQ